MITDGESVLDHVVGLGATLIVTPTQLILVRQGAHFRPRTGVRAWPFDGIHDLRLFPPRNGNGRIVVLTGAYPWQAVSLFVGTEQWPVAERVVIEIRGRVAQARRTLHPRRTKSTDAPATDPRDDG